MDKTVEKSPGLKPSIYRATHRSMKKTTTSIHNNPSSSDDRAVSEEVLIRQQAYGRPDSRKGSRLASSPLDTHITELVDTSTMSVPDMERERVNNLMGKSPEYIHTCI